MKILILTQKVDKTDSLLGFFHRWIEEFAKQCEHVVVICLEEGEHDLPKNVKVLSLGKENYRPSVIGYQIIKRVKYIYNFYRYIWRERNNYDYVFVHMNREYVLLGGLLWRLLGKKIALWWVHFETPLALRLALLFSHAVFTASKESFQLRSRKARIVGHGIDIARFERTAPYILKEPIQILYVGKITPIKNIHILVESGKLLKNSWDKTFVITCVGPTTTKENEGYKKELKERILQYGLQRNIRFTGAVPYTKIREAYEAAHVVVNLCPTGGIDKMVLESAASKVPVIVSNETFRAPFGKYAEELLYPYQDAPALAEKIKNLFKKNETDIARMREFLYTESRNHSLQNLIRNIVHTMKKL